ncbi:MAG: D-glycero-beta-D-manno-heptose-7-phosphate kinase [Clostridia bacterium]|nr:D-glycero-beta-D-manno-heptose-7-phosphate kinase [Clostridia bacterium]
MSRNEFLELFDSFTTKTIMIIGDVMIDSYIFGSVDRISPEAPVPVVAVSKRSVHLGGAANVALNIKAMGARPVLCSVTGQDDKSQEFMHLMQENDLFTGAILRSSNRITTTKFRIMGNNVQLLRVDEECTEPLSESDMQTFLHLVEVAISEQHVDAIIFQDYDKGVITPGLIDKVAALASNLRIPVAADPKRRNFDAYKNITLFKPNLKELNEGLGMDVARHDNVALRLAARKIHQQQQVDLVMITLSEDGIFVSRRNDDETFTDHHLPAHRRSIADVSGAGDTVISIATLGLAAGMADKDIAALSNLAGGQVCEHVGVVPVRKEKLLQEWTKMNEATW